MYETQVTVVGNLLTEVDTRRFNDGSTIANFRVASRERRYDRAGGTWVDGDRLFIDVRCRRRLAENATSSLKKGDPVVVTGRIFTRDYEHQGQRRTATTLEAHSVAADLTYCTVVLTRTRRAADAVGGEDGKPTVALPDGHEADRNAGELDGDPAGPVERAIDRRPDGAHPDLVGVAPGDEG